MQPTVLRLHPDLRHRLMRDAKAHGRSLSKEIEMLLREALDAHDRPGLVGTAEPKAAWPQTDLIGVRLSDTEAAVVNVFRKMPPEKQLALLSLLR